MYEIIVAGILFAIITVLGILFKKQYNQCVEELHRQQEKMILLEKQCDESGRKNVEFRTQMTSDFEVFSSVTKQQMFIHEALLLNEHGEWCLTHDGERKYFTPGKLQKVSSAKTQEESSFQYNDDCVICAVTQNGNLKSELIYSLGGAPKSGKIYSDGVLIKNFTYNELGQAAVVDRKEGK